jgi:flagellar basal body-associated protein FliL
MLTEQPSQGGNILFIITIVLFLLTIVVLCIGFWHTRKPTAEEKPMSDIEADALGTSIDINPIARAYESAKINFLNWVGKTILYMNMRGDAIVYNYPFEKGFVEKLFIGVTAPR